MEIVEQQLNHDRDNSDKIIYRDVELANEVEDAVLAVDFGEGRRVVPVSGAGIIAQLHESGLGIDYRVTADNKLGYASVFEGIAFDPDNVRSQSFAIYEGEKPIGSMSFLTAPKAWIAKQRYFQKCADGIRVVDAHAISGTELPEFYIIPGWTQVLDSHRGLLARPGFSAFKNVVDALENSAPEGTWVEVIARGQLPPEMDKIAFELAYKEVGTVIPFDEFPFEADMIGLCNENSTSTVKMARLMGLAEIDNLGSVSSLGPVFAKKIR